MSDSKIADLQLQPRVVGVVDDNSSFRAAIARLLRTAGYQVKTFSSAEELATSGTSANLGCLVLDVHMPGRTGFELQETLIGTGDDIPIVFVSGYGDVPQSVRAMKLGAIDFLTKPVASKDLLEAIKRALAKEAYLRANREERMRLAERLSRLTPRERQVFEMTVTGMMNKQIAFALGTSVHTVKVHRGRVMAKMEADSLTDLVRMFLKLKPPITP